MRRIWTVGIAVAAGLTILAVLTLTALQSDHPDAVARPWTRFELSKDGLQLRLWVEKPSGPACEVFDHIEVERHNGSATAAAIYRRTSQGFCNASCSLEDELQEVTLDEPLTGVAIGPAPETRPSCR